MRAMGDFMKRTGRAHRLVLGAPKARLERRSSAGPSANWSLPFDKLRAAFRGLLTRVPQNEG
jgi:hypothetical protein